MKIKILDLNGFSCYGLAVYVSIIIDNKVDTNKILKSS